MNKLLSKKSVKAICFAATAIVICFFSLYFATFAQQNGQNGQTQETETKDINCVTDMKPYIQEKSKEFREYLTQHFQNKSTNSSLLNIALERFKEYKADLNKKLQTYYPQAGLPQYSETLESLACYQQMNKEIYMMRNLLEKFYLETSSVKTTSTHMSKLKNINEKLDELNRNVSQMYGKWEALKDKFPCYVTNCLSG